MYTSTVVRGIQGVRCSIPGSRHRTSVKKKPIQFLCILSSSRAVNVSLSAHVQLFWTLLPHRKLDSWCKNPTSVQNAGGKKPPVYRTLVEKPHQCAERWWKNPTSVQNAGGKNPPVTESSPLVLLCQSRRHDIGVQNVKLSGENFTSSHRTLNLFGGKSDLCQE